MPPADEADGFRQAIPDKDQIQIKLPGSQAGGANQPLGYEEHGTAQQALLGETATLHVVTRDISWAVNSAAYLWLSLTIDPQLLEPPEGSPEACVFPDNS